MKINYINKLKYCPSKSEIFQNELKKIKKKIKQNIIITIFML